MANWGKWSKYKVLVGSPELRSALPATRTLTEANFNAMLERYGNMIVKPNGSSGGFGVMLITAKPGGTYEVHYGTRRSRFHSRAAAYSFVRRTGGRHFYIVQKRISLAKVNGRPFDVRVMVQRRRGSSHWTVTGKLAKIAGPGFVITNTARSHGRVTTTGSALRSSNASHSDTGRIEKRMDAVSLAAVRRLYRHYRWIRSVGMDLGVDTSGKVWIIEANFAPSKSLFRRLKDHTMYRRILSYSR